MRKKIVAGNWKMNNNFEEAEELIFQLGEKLDGLEVEAEVVVCPPYLYLEYATDLAQETEIKTGAQNVSNHASGAYTGEISAGMLAAMDLDYCIVGHSERRKYFGENDAIIAEKVKQLLQNDIRPIFCCGELLEQREAGDHFKVVSTQLEEGLFHLKKEDFLNVVIAYEPVWAIGTGVTASPEQAQEMHAFIRSLISNEYGADVANDISLLYGGSCKASNAASLFSQPDVDGGLIGGASLDAGEFFSIITSFNK